MSNERIDLTQFEKMIGGTWSIEWLHGDPENEEPSAAIQSEDYGTIAQTFYRDWDKPYEATTKAMAAVPDLLAELKRCYEELDWRHKVISALIEANTVKGEILDRLRTCDECGEPWDNHNSGADCEVDRQPASE